LGKRRAGLLCNQSVWHIKHAQLDGILKIQRLHHERIRAQFVRRIHISHSIRLTPLSLQILDQLRPIANHDDWVIDTRFGKSPPYQKHIRPVVICQEN
jgi:hypothetical protein